MKDKSVNYNYSNDKNLSYCKTADKVVQHRFGYEPRDMGVIRRPTHATSMVELIYCKS